MQPIASEAIDELIQEIQEDDGEIHPLWFFSIEGEALWSQDHIGVPLISGMSVKRPGFNCRVVSMEDCAMHGITIIRVKVSENSPEPNLGDDPRFYSPVYQAGLRSEYPDPEGDRVLELLIEDQLRMEREEAEQEKRGESSWWRKFFPFF